MTNCRIEPGPIKGTIKIPPSKSQTLRAILFGFMGKGKSIIHNYLPSPDTRSMIDAICCLGGVVEITPHTLIIEGVNGILKPAENVIQAGNSGLVLRLIGALSALSPTYTVLTGDDSIRHNRLIFPLLDAFQRLGLFATSIRGDGHAPIIIKGPHSGGKTAINGEDSQPLSGLLIASAFAPKKTEIIVYNPGEKPWIDLTLSWLDRFDLGYYNDQYTFYTVEGKGSYDGFEYDVPGDLSSAAYPIAAALITHSEVTLTHIDLNDAQGDKKLIHILEKMGAKIDVNPQNKTLSILKGPPLKGRRIDINDFIDAITILPVIASFAEGPTEIINGAIARKKECDRIKAITHELKKMGAKIEEKEDGFIIYPSPLHGTDLNTYHDHRMALSLSTAALGAKGNSCIHGIEAASKTYPYFLEQFQSLGMHTQLIHSLEDDGKKCKD